VAAVLLQRNEGQNEYEKDDDAGKTKMKHGPLKTSSRLQTPFLAPLSTGWLGIAPGPCIGLEG